MGAVGTGAHLALLHAGHLDGHKLMPQAGGRGLGFPRLRRRLHRLLGEGWTGWPAPSPGNCGAVAAACTSPLLPPPLDECVCRVMSSGVVCEVPLEGGSLPMGFPGFPVSPGVGVAKHPWMS